MSIDNQFEPLAVTALAVALFGHHVPQNVQ
jgi:hypothetical protein